jgi:hypothetical protein
MWKLDKLGKLSRNFERKGEVKPAFIATAQNQTIMIWNMNRAVVA